MSKQHQQHALSPEKYIRTRARTLPIGTCYINPDWEESGFATIFMSRRHINGNITHAAYLVDIFCLGLKESYWVFNQDALDYKDFIEKQLQGNPHGFSLMKADYVLLHNIIFGAIEYAGELGFLPHKSFETTKYILEEDDDHVKLLDLTFGYKGKPLFISSPERPAEKNRVLACLEKNPGSGNYYYIVDTDAPEFFEKEEEKEREKANYHDPEVKRGLIKDFIARVEGPAVAMFENIGKIKEMVNLTDTIFFEYMASDDDLVEASKIIENLFDFGISDEIFSDEMLAGKSLVPHDPREIRLQAERLYTLCMDGHTAEGLRQARAMMDKYPGFPVFEFMYMRFLEHKEGMIKLMPKLEKCVIQNPGYHPLGLMFAFSFLLNKPEDVSRQMDDSLHLKTVYPHRKTFCKEEVLLYLRVLTANYNNALKFEFIEIMFSYMEYNFPGVMPEHQVISAKLYKIPLVMEWCKSWMESEMK